MNVAGLCTCLTSLAAAAALFFRGFRWLKRITDGQKCQLRGEMLRLYYEGRHSRSIRQYEYENFLMMFAAYKSLGGNSFIDKIHEEMRSWTVE